MTNHVLIVMYQKCNSLSSVLIKHKLQFNPTFAIICITILFPSNTIGLDLIVLIHTSLYMPNNILICMEWIWTQSHILLKNCTHLSTVSEVMTKIFIYTIHGNVTEAVGKYSYPKEIYTSGNIYSQRRKFTHTSYIRYSFTINLTILMC